MSRFLRSKYDCRSEPPKSIKVKAPSTHELLLDIMSNNMFMPEKDIQLSSKLVEDLGMEELDIVEVVIDIEQRFNIEVDDDDIDDLITFHDLMNYVTKHLVKR